jgi:antitoxin component of MazEF toxin-antitoxin module
MATVTRKVDAKGRVVLPEEFAGRTVRVEVVGDGQVLVRVARPPRRRPTLSQLMAGVTRRNLPERVEFGAPVGDEAL